MFRITSFFKTPKPRQFNFRTRYYDADKEALDARVEKAKKEAQSESAGEGGSPGERLRIQFENRRQNRKRHDSRQSNLRILLITGILGALIYLILK